MKLIHRFKTIQQATLLFAGIVLLFSAVSAAENQQVPIHIEADRMVSQEQDNTVIFSGNVDARQGELLIRTDEMTVYYIEDETGSEKKATSEVHKLICRGNVQISQGDWLGTGERMDYFARDRKVILSGNAKGWQGQNMVAGKTITYFLDEGRSIVESPVAADGETGDGESTKGRVKAVIHPDEARK
ncbi:MAG TPA: lipopolysaccharide transport periplasmic protein LptA [Desulfobacteraceae bacterium]|nr:lipopolysaccharide transport periplasmic protein LptA [Desulfobacteraceae bacterium]